MTGSSPEVGINDDYATIKYDSSGIQKWIKRYNGPGNNFDKATSIAVDTSGNIYITGESSGIGSDLDYATIKYSSSGVQQWVIRYNGSGNFSDRAKSIAVDGSGNVYITGYSLGNGTHYDYATIKYSIVTNLNNNTYTNAKGFKLHQNYPNPFNPATVIRYTLIENRIVMLKVHDVLGSEITTLVNEKQNAGSYSVEFDASNYPSGVYYYKLEAGDFSEVRKMILLK